MFLVFLMVIMLEIFAVTVISSIICKDTPSENLMCCLRSIYGVLCRNIYISIHPHLYSYIYVCRHGYQLDTLLHFDNQLQSYTRLKPTQLKNMLITLVFVSSSNDTQTNMKLSATHFERVAFTLSDV